MEIQRLLTFISWLFVHKRFEERTNDKFSSRSRGNISQSMLTGGPKKEIFSGSFLGYIMVMREIYIHAHTHIYIYIYIYISDGGDEGYVRNG